MQSLLASIDRDGYASAARSDQTEVLIRDVYPLERAFEILSNYTAELAKSAIAFLGQDPRDAVQNLRSLADERAVTRSRAERLIGVHRTRNNLVHQYPDMRARMLFEAAEILERELGPFLRDLTSWFIGRLDRERSSGGSG